MKIIEYSDNDHVIVEFDNGYKKNTTYRYFKKGNVKSLYAKTVFDVGYIGEGKYQPSIDGKNTIYYTRWFSMLQRCYYNKYQTENSSYIGCRVCEEWHNFQNFAEWYKNNYYKIENERMELDKDILFKNNKEYNPNSCVFVPQRINSLFTKSNKTKGKFPIGVYYNTHSNKFLSQCNSNGKRKKLGSFNTPEEAFVCYKKAKESEIKRVADEYKDKIPQKLYDALYNYEVEITD